MSVQPHQSAEWTQWSFVFQAQPVVLTAWLPPGLPLAEPITLRRHQLFLSACCLIFLWPSHVDAPRQADSHSSFSTNPRILFRSWFTYLFELVPSEVTVKDARAIRVLKNSLTIHLPVSEMALVLVTLCPCEFTCSFHDVFLELALESASICEDSEALPVLHVSVPIAFVFGQDAIHVACTIIDLQAIAMSYPCVGF